MTLPPPPPDLPANQQPIWADTTTRLTQLDITTADPHHIRAYVAAVHRHTYLTHLIDQSAPMIDRDGKPTVNPAIAPQRQAAHDIARLARTLGLTRTAAPVVNDAGGDPMRVGVHGPHDHWGARYCNTHQRWECTGNRSKGRGQCHGQAQRGTPTCRMHQGRGGPLKHAAAVAAEEGDRVAGPLPGGRALPDVHPADALMHQVRYWAGMCAWLDDVVAGLEQGAMTWGVTREQEATGGEFPGTLRIKQAGLSVWAEWHMKAHRHLTMVCEIALRNEVDKEALNIQRAQEMQAFRAFQAGLQRLQLNAEQWTAAREVMPQVLRALAAA